MKYPLLDQLNQYIAEGFATARKHPRLPLRIYNYSTRAQYNFTAETWPQELRDARGLVLDPDGEIVARGFRKFFNLSQLQNWPAGKPELSSSVGIKGLHPVSCTFSGKSGSVISR